MGKPVGQVIRELREASNMTRSEVARRAKLDPSVLWRLENPRPNAQPSFDLIRRVARSMGVSLEVISDAIDRSKSLPDPTPHEQLDRIAHAVDALKRSINTNARKGQK